MGITGDCLFLGGVGTTSGEKRPHLEEWRERGW
jgi:hypothetical protein